MAQKLGSEPVTRGLHPYLHPSTGCNSLTACLPPLVLIWSVLELELDPRCSLASLFQVLVVLVVLVIGLGRKRPVHAVQRCPGCHWWSVLGETLCRTQYSSSIQTVPVLEEEDHPHYTGFLIKNVELLYQTPVFLSTGSIIWYPDNVIIFVLIEPSETHGLFNPDVQSRRMGFCTRSYSCFNVILTGPANKLWAEVAIKIIAENISFSRGCWSDCCNNRILIMLQITSGLLLHKPSGRGQRKPCVTSSQMQSCSTTAPPNATASTHTLLNSSKHRCFLSDR